MLCVSLCPKERHFDRSASQLHREARSGEICCRRLPLPSPLPLPLPLPLLLPLPLPLLLPCRCSFPCHCSLLCLCRCPCGCLCRCPCGCLWRCPCSCLCPSWLSSRRDLRLPLPLPLRDSLSPNPQKRPLSREICCCLCPWLRLPLFVTSR